MEKIKKIWNLVWGFLNSRLFVLGLIFLMFLFLAGQCKKIIDTQTEIMVRDQNISALKDSLKTEKTKNGSLLVSIDGYIATEKELKKLNNGLWILVNDQKGKVVSLTNAVIRLKQDSALLSKTVDELRRRIGEIIQVNDSTYLVPWTIAQTYDSTNYDIFEGKTLVTVLNKDPLKLRHKDTYLFSRESQVDLIWGQKVEKGKLRVFVQSGYPGFTVRSMEGVLIDPNNNPLFKDLMKKQHWFSGFGVGPNLSLGWNVLEAKPAIIVGVGFHYNIYQW
jgi:hypothetical protein